MVHCLSVGSTSANQAAAQAVDKLSPAMRQYVEQKRRVGDAVLFFRMGDFYETFYEDAVLCSKVLGITLTSRDKSTNAIPLAGIPYHALDNYLKKLVVAGHRVAISEQLEDPKQAKGVIRRDVVRIVTAGTLTDEALLEQTGDNLLAAVCIRGDRCGLAVVELAGGRFEVIDVTPDSLLDELVRCGPAEMLVSEDDDGPAKRIAEQVTSHCGCAVTRRPEHEFTPFQAEKSLLDHFGTTSLAGFGFDGMNESLCAAGCAIQYLCETQKTALGHIHSICRRVPADYVQIDHCSWRSLEIERTIRTGSREGTLLAAVDRTVHAIGGRRLRHWLQAPLTDREEIERRQDAVGLLAETPPLRVRVRELVGNMADVERITGRVALSRATPRDLAALGGTLAALPDVAEELDHCHVEFLKTVVADFTGLEELADLLKQAIRENCPASTRESGFMADGFNEELDRLRAISQDGKSWLADYQRRETDRTGIAHLKVGFNRVFGYYIEIPNSGRDKVPPEYVRRQTIKNAERYITDELKKYESEVLTAQERAHELECRLFEQVCEQVAAQLAPLMRVADAIGRLDCVAGLAELAITRRYVRPEVIDGIGLEIRDGRHPVLDRVLGDSFVPNDTMMCGSDGRILVITGPNMAGKSTYIRQIALLTLLAQTGSFVPAVAMKWSIADRIFARVGASDEIMRGQSTFMVEMTEAANILHNATDRSLVVLDELGRGTSTFDGLSLAWAITEHLADAIKCRTLVATHYHELAELAATLPNVRNYNVAVREYPAGKGREGDIVFLHRIVEGSASKSYGVHVARLAGIPHQVVKRSAEVLAELQRNFERESHKPQLSPKAAKDDGQGLLFRDPAEALAEELASVDPDRTTPLEALEKLKSWKDRFGS